MFIFCDGSEKICVFVCRPHLEALRAALEELLVLGALDKAVALTPLGHKMAVFPVEPNLAKVSERKKIFIVFHHLLFKGADCGAWTQGAA